MTDYNHIESNEFGLLGFAKLCFNSFITEPRQSAVTATNINIASINNHIHTDKWSKCNYLSPIKFSTMSESHFLNIEVRIKKGHYNKKSTFGSSQKVDNVLV